MLKKETVEHVSKLARLKLNSEELDSFSKTLSTILSHFEQIAAVDTENVRPLITPTDMTVTLREDIVEKSLESDILLENAPEKSGRLFKVPPVV